MRAGRPIRLRVAARTPEYWDAGHIYRVGAVVDIGWNQFIISVANPLLATVLFDRSNPALSVRERRARHVVSLWPCEHPADRYRWVAPKHKNTVA